MDLPNLQDLDKIIALCRKRGVKSIKIDNVELTLSEEAPPKQTRRRKEAAAPSTSDEIETNELTPEQILFFSVRDDAHGEPS